MHQLETRKLNCVQYHFSLEPGLSDVTIIVTMLLDDVHYLSGSASAPSLGRDLGLLALGHPDSDLWLE